ncbi:MAG: flagellar biosynthetic protein FliO [Pirellulales bacterium]
MVKTTALVVLAAVVAVTIVRAGHAAQHAGAIGEMSRSHQSAAYPPGQSIADRAHSAARHTVYLQGDQPTAASEQPSAPPASDSASTPSRRLPPPGDALSGTPPQRALAGGLGTPRGGLPSLTTALAGLAFVLGLFLLFAWVLKRSLPKSAAPLPTEVVEVLGRVPLAARNFAHLVRLGNKLVLVSISSAGIEALSEITDPAEVDRLAGICEQSRPTSSSQAFRGVLQSFARETSGTDPRSAGQFDGLRSLSREVRDG